MSLDNALAVIIGQDENQLLTKVADALAEQPEGATHKDGAVRATYEQIAALGFNSKSYDDVAKMVVALAAFNPFQAAQAISATSVPIQQPIGQGVHIRPEYIMGVVLGIFEAGVWLDEKWRCAESLEQALPDVLANFIYSPRLTRANLGLGVSGVCNTGYESRLNDAIKKFARGEFVPEGQRSQRVREIFRTIRWLQEATPRDTELPYLAEMVVDQICYAQFGAISSTGRLDALKALHDQLVPHPRR
jgi:hypothetical protein